jgi:CheY-like chemotaxis protein
VLKDMKSDAKLKCIPVVMLTSSREDRDIEEAYRLGANSFVVKPVDFHEFIDVIKQIGAYWAVVSEPPPSILCKTKETS